MRRWHPDVDNGQFGSKLADELEQLGGVARLPHDVETGSFQQAGKPLAEQYIVVGDDHTHGIHPDDSRIRESMVTRYQG